MKLKILSKCDADEAKNIAKNSIFELEQGNFTEDTYLAGIKLNLTTETNSLSDSIGVERKHEYTTELAQKDEIFDKRVICFKTFVSANTYSSDVQIAANAEKIWNKIESFDPLFYKLGYEKELARAFSMIEELEQPDVKTILDSLVGATNPLADVKSAAKDLIDLYRKNQNVLAQKETIVPSSTQKKTVIQIINEKLLPYLSVMSEVKGGDYKKVHTNITQYIETVNTKIRTRLKRVENQDKDLN
ncbi:MAG: DUF6261 family protein [Bacteroidales bacterium]|nr:DUF6261 family protein [Bacteroidales bacterium]